MDAAKIITLTRSEAIDILGALTTGADLALAIENPDEYDLEVAAEIVDAVTLLTLRLYHHLPDEDA